MSSAKKKKGVGAFLGGFLKSFRTAETSPSGTRRKPEVQLKDLRCLIVGAANDTGRELAQLLAKETPYIALATESSEEIKPLINNLRKSNTKGPTPAAAGKGKKKASSDSDSDLSDTEGSDSESKSGESGSEAGERKDDSSDADNGTVTIFPVLYDPVQGKSAAEKMVKTVLEKLDYIDVFFFVLEEPMHVRFEDIVNMEASAKRMMQVNYLSAVYITHALLPKLRERKGKIVILSSIDSEKRKNLSLFSASRSALHGFFQDLKVEEGPTIQVSILLDSNPQKQELDSSGALSMVDLSSSSSSSSAPPSEKSVQEVATKLVRLVKEGSSSSSSSHH